MLSYLYSIFSCFEWHTAQDSCQMGHFMNQHARETLPLYIKSIWVLGSEVFIDLVQFLDIQKLL